MIPQLETERLILKAPEEKDLDTYQKLFNNWELTREDWLKTQNS